MRQTVRTAIMAVSAQHCEEAKILFAKFTTVPTVGRRTLINDLIIRLKNAGVWQRLDYLHIYAAHASQAGQLNWRNPSTIQATPTSSPTFTTDRGYNGNGSSSYVKTNYNPTTGPGLYTQNDCHLGLWGRSAGAIGGGDLGMRTSSSAAQSMIQVRSATDQILFRPNVNAAPTSVGTTTDATGHHVTRRTASNAGATFQNGVQKQTFTDASVAVANLDFYLGAINTNGTAGVFSNRPYAASHAGASLTDQQIADFYAALQIYMTAVGA